MLRTSLQLPHPRVHGSSFYEGSRAYTSRPSAEHIGGLTWVLLPAAAWLPPAPAAGPPAPHHPRGPASAPGVPSPTRGTAPAVLQLLRCMRGLLRFLLRCMCGLLLLLLLCLLRCRRCLYLLLLLRLPTCFACFAGLIRRCLLLGIAAVAAV